MLILKILSNLKFFGKLEIGKITFDFLVASPKTLETWVEF